MDNIDFDHLTIIMRRLALQAGDKIITRDSGMAVLRDIREATSMMQPIRVKAGSLGHTRPDRDMMVTPNTRIHIRDWRAEALFGTPTAMVAAHKLVDGEYLAPQPVAEADVFELVFDRPHIVYADGMEMLVG